ncbi:TPA: hypothetical protein ACH3X1_014057 [Trebouxia sp. C0004]
MSAELSADQRTSLVAGMPEAFDKRNSPAAGTGAGGTNYSHGSAYDTGDNVKGYMGTQDVVSSGQGYMTTPTGAGPGFGLNNEGSGHNTGIGVSGAGTGTGGYHHGTGGVTDAGDLSTNKEDAHKLKNLLHLHHCKH